MYELSTLQTKFESRTDEIARLTRYHFRGYGPEATDEAVQNTLGLCWLYFVRLNEAGKADDCFDQTIGFAIKHTLMGRMPQGRDKAKSKCVLDYARHAKHDVACDRADLDVFVGKSASVPDAAAFHIDTPAFLATLSERNRAIANDLASGLSTTEVARKRGVTPAAISQFRERFRNLYRSFHGENAA